MPYLFAVIVAVVGFFALTRSKSQAPKTVPNTTDQEMVSDNSMDQSGDYPEDKYLAYTKQDFEKSKDKRRVLYFYANWCSTCRPANADFVKNSKLLPEDVEVFRVNYDDSETDEEEKDLAKKYQITYQHTFVQVDANDDVVTRWNGGELKDLLKRIK